MMNLARTGDVIEAKVRHPVPGTIRLRLDTPEACAQANELLLSGQGGWKLVPPDRANS